MMARIDLRMSASMEPTRPDDSRSRLSQTLAGVLDGADITDLHRLSGGASRETWRFLADGVPRIVQRQRAGDERDMMIEAAVVRAAGRRRGARSATPRRRAAAGRRVVHGARSDRRARRSLARSNATTSSATARRHLVADLGTALARIHSLDTTGLARPDRDRPGGVLHEHRSTRSDIRIRRSSWSGTG